MAVAPMRAIFRIEPFWRDTVTNESFAFGAPELIRDQAQLDRIEAAGAAWLDPTFDPVNPGPIGGGVASSGLFTTLGASGLVTFGPKSATTSNAAMVATARSSFSPGLEIKNFDAAGWARLDLRHESATGGAFMYQQSTGQLNIRNDTSTAPITFQQGSSSRFQVGATGGIVVGSPTGGDQGPGTINATAVYDDNALLSCYVFEAYLDGAVDVDAWHARVPDRVIPAVIDLQARDTGVLDSAGNPVIEYEEVELEGERVEEREHVGAKKFAARLGTGYDPTTLDGYARHWQELRHLTAMPRKDGYDPLRGLTTGEWIQRLVETAEIQAVLIEQLNQLNKDLAARVEALEAAAAA